jgi:hypothetical protein
MAKKQPAESTPTSTRKTAKYADQTVQVGYSWGSASDKCKTQSGFNHSARHSRRPYLLTMQGGDRAMSSRFNIGDPVSLTV